jgi:glycosyltransferase 2 family protein
MRRWLSVGAGTVVVVLGLVFVVRRIVDEWSAVETVLSSAQPVLLAVGLVLAVLAMALVGWRWHRAMLLLGGNPAAASSLRWFAAGQLGKYVPGGFWHVLGQGELARRGGVDRPISYGSVGLSTISLYGTAGLVVTAVSVVPDGLRPAWWVVAGASAVFVVSAEPLVVGRLLRRLRVASIPDRRQLLLYSIGNLPMWLAVALATLVVARGLGATGATWTIMGAAVASWVVGFLALPAPGGLGVREAAFVTFVYGAMPGGVAAAVALASRLTFLVADGLLFAVVVGSGVHRAAATAAMNPHEPDGSDAQRI